MKPFMDSILDFESSDPSSTLGRQGQENRTCSFCLKTFFGITARRKHEENVHQGKVKGFKCDLCDKSYSNNNALSYHKNTKHEDIVSKFNCNVCGLKFSTDRTLSRHRKSIHGEENGSGEAKFDWSQCGTTFSRINCDICGSTFKRKSGL